MDKYKINSLNEIYFITADNWSVGHDGLKFFQNEKIVAWFTSWNYWMLENEGQ